MSRRRSRPSRSQEAPVPPTDSPDAASLVPAESAGESAAVTAPETNPAGTPEASAVQDPATAPSPEPAEAAGETSGLGTPVDGESIPVEAEASAGISETESVSAPATEPSAVDAGEWVGEAATPAAAGAPPEAVAAALAGPAPLELKFIVESLLFSAQKALTTKELKDFLVQASQDETAPEAAAYRKVKEADLAPVLQTLQAEHEAAGRSYRLWCVAGAWQFVSEARYAPWLRALLGRKARPPRLSQPGIETLTIIAYRQPATRAEIEQIRGVSVDGVMQTLLERGLVEAVGRAEVIGRPVTYGTTPAFLEYFGLRALEDLPAAEELRRIPVQKPEALATVDPGLSTAPPDAPVPQVDLPSVDPVAAGLVPPAAAEPSPGPSPDAGGAAEKS